MRGRRSSGDDVMSLLGTLFRALSVATKSFTRRRRRRARLDNQRPVVTELQARFELGHSDVMDQAQIAYQSFDSLTGPGKAHEVAAKSVKEVTGSPKS